MSQLSNNNFFFIGNFGYTSAHVDGQTVKTRSIYELYCAKLNQELPYYDTDLIKYNKSSIIPAILDICKSKHIIYLPAYKNLKYFFPFLYFLSKLFRFKIHLFTVGGWFENFINRHNWIASKLKKIEVIYFQANELVSAMKNDYHFSNVTWIPNFRNVENKRSTTVTNINSTDSMKIVFMSRINRKKGIDVIFECLNQIKNHEAYQKLSIDFFGPIHEPDMAYFESQLSLYSNTNYKGVLPPNEVHDTLQLYDILLLPTKYFTEGFPGAILDAYTAGIPVIASKWRFAEEFVKDGKTGFIIPFGENTAELIEKVLFLISNHTFLEEMKIHAEEFSKKFTPKNAWRIILKKIDNK